MRERCARDTREVHERARSYYTDLGRSFYYDAYKDLCPHLAGIPVPARRSLFGLRRPWIRVRGARRRGKATRCVIFHIPPKTELRSRVTSEAVERPAALAPVKPSCGPWLAWGGGMLRLGEASVPNQRASARRTVSGGGCLHRSGHCFCWQADKSPVRSLVASLARAVAGAVACETDVAPLAGIDAHEGRHPSWPEKAAVPVPGRTRQACQPPGTGTGPRAAFWRSGTRGRRIGACYHWTLMDRAMARRRQDQQETGQSCRPPPART